MKKKILLFAIVLITIFAAASCSYTFEAVALVNVKTVNGIGVEDAYVYLFETEENAQIGFNILKGNDNHNILDYVYRGSEPVMTNESGNATIPIRWITSSPTDGKDNDQKNFWMVAVIQSAGSFSIAAPRFFTETEQEKALKSMHLWARS